MEKLAQIAVIYFLSVLFLLGFVDAQSGVGIGLQILDTSGPIVRLVNPLNNSGNHHGNMSFSYNVSDSSSVSNCSLIINGRINSTDISITKGTRLIFLINNTAVGKYNWSINCTDSLGFVGESPTRVFSIQNLPTSKFNGTLTNLSAIDIRNITNLVIATSGFGKINFSVPVDLSESFDFNNFINISFNKIELDSSALGALNKSATLQIAGLTFSNPKILADGNECPESICKKVSYTDGILTFNVSHWTSYSSEETPSESSTTTTTGSGGGASSGGGGGGPPAAPVVTDFSLDKTSIKVILKQGETKKEMLKIKNIGTTIFDVKAILEEIGKFKVEPATEEIVTSLSPNEEKTIEFVFKALENEKPEIYPGKITLKSPSSRKEIAAIVEVDSAQPLFDVDVEVLPDSKKVYPGQEVSLDVSLFNVRGFGRVDVEIEYSIKDLKGNVIAAEHETLAVETQAKFTRRILVPSYLEPGSYVAFAKVTYADSVGVSSDLFEVQAKTIKLSLVQLKDYRIILAILAGALIFGSLIFMAYKFRPSLKKKAPATPEEEVKQIKEEEKAEKLRKELKALESAYKSGFISEESYKRDKKRIEDKLK
jgi:uncharacterized membrane protein YgcG